MEFAILGPLEVTDGGRPLAIAGSRTRGLLALLLLNANQAVSSDRLLSELWGDEPPVSGVTALQVRVSQLRKTLGESGSLIVTRTPGYTIQLRPGQLDLHRFERLCREAESAEPALAAAKLREALGLWRGPALGDLAYEPFAQAAIGRLEELRLAALERRIDADLALGRHAELAGELQQLVAENPLRERLHLQLMLALYRARRQAEALEAYRETRTALDEQLGIAPSPALQELERAILRQDASLELVSPAAPERSVLVTPWTEGVSSELLSLAAALATRPRREIVLVGFVTDAADLAEGSAMLKAQRDLLVADGLLARAAAFTSATPGRDIVRTAAELEVDLLLVSAPSALLDDSELVTMLQAAPCDVALLVGSGPTPGPVLVPFAGSEHDWSAVELGAWLAGAWGKPLLLAGPTANDGRDASRQLASASLAVQRAFGVAAEPLILETGAAGLLGAAAEAAVVVAGLSERWRGEGLGEVRGALARESRSPVLLVRRGLRPGGLAPREGLTRFTWSLAPRSP